MAKVLITESNLSNIADAIRIKNGQSSATYTPTQMAPAILAIPAGGGGANLQTNKNFTPSTSTVGYFQPYDYHLIYIYEE